MSRASLVRDRAPARLPLPLYSSRPLSDPFLTYGPACRAYASAAIGLELLAWQRWTLDRMLEVDPRTGRLRWREVLISVARRNGKTTLVRALVAWTLGPSPVWRRSVNAANTAQQARYLFDAVALDGMSLGMEGNASGTRVGVGYPDSDRRHVYVTGRSEGWRGMGQDLVVLDEVQEQTDEDAWAAAEPMIRTSSSGQLLAIGTASTERAVLFRRLYDRARLAIMDPAEDPGFGVFVWEAASDDDAGIRAANPATADGLLRMDVLRATRKSQSPPRFASETLNRWISDDVFGSFPPGSWEGCADPAARAPAGRPDFAVDVSPGWDRASIVACIADHDTERLHVELAVDWPDRGRPIPEGDVVREVRRLLVEYPGARVGYDPGGSPIAGAMRRLEGEGLAVVPVGGGLFRQACATFLGHVVNGRIVHRGEPVLSAAVRAAARSEDAELWRWVRRRSAGPIDALCAATIAAYLAELPAPSSGVFG
jgi:phage terminase large subunit-like protein